MEQRLNDELLKIVDWYMDGYKEDVDADIQQILKQKDINNFIWVVRKSGTMLFYEKNLMCKNSGEHDCYMNFVGQTSIVYKITITKRGSKYIYGALEKISKASLTEKVKNGRTCKEVLIKIIKKDNTEVFHTTPIDDLNLNSIMNVLKLNKEDISKIICKEYI